KIFSIKINVFSYFPIHFQNQTNFYKKNIKNN
ncbi:MAG: hypothetical protein ACI9JY_001958, partial [Saprospiraceae bacterium]